MESGWHRKGWLKKMAVGVPLEQDQVLDGSSHPPERCLTFPSGQEGLVRIRGAKAATGLPGSCQESNGSGNRTRAAMEHRVGRGAGPVAERSVTTGHKGGTV